MSEQIRERKVEYWDFDALIPYENNAKNHPKDQVQRLAASIKEFGWASAKAIEVDSEGVIINGHGRRLAAKHLGMKKVPVVVRDDLTPEQVRAYRLADNKAAESTYDTDLLAGELIDLKELDFDMTDFFDEREFDFMVEDLGQIDSEAISESLGDEMKSFADKTDQAVTEADEKPIPVHEALGFKTVSLAQMRRLAALQAHAEQVTGELGAIALAQFTADFVGVEN